MTSTAFIERVSNIQSNDRHWILRVSNASLQLMYDLGRTIPLADSVLIHEKRLCEWNGLAGENAARKASDI